MRRTLEQKRAQESLRFIRFMATGAEKPDTWPETDRKFRAKMNTLIQKAPVQVLQNGLGQMLAFLLADNGDKTGTNRKASGILYRQLEKWLCGEPDDTYPCRMYPDTRSLIEELVEGDRATYLRAQKETLALFVWLKKFATAWLDEGEE